MTERHSVQVLRDCIDLQIAKGSDYQNAVSTVKQADYYRLGLNTIYDIMHAKMLRIRSLLETAEANGAVNANFESISDSAKDLINYASFFASYAEGKMDGQNPEHDIFNKRKTKTPLKSPGISVVETDYSAVEPIVAQTSEFLETGNANGAMFGHARPVKTKNNVDDLVRFLDTIPEEHESKSAVIRDYGAAENRFTVNTAGIPADIAEDEEKYYVALDLNSRHW